MGDEPEWLKNQRIDEFRRTNFLVASSALAALTPVLMVPAYIAAENGLLHTPVAVLVYAIMAFSFWWVDSKKAESGSTLRYAMRLLTIVCAFMLVIFCLISLS
jgi:hypothetical protein